MNGFCWTLIGLGFVCMVALTVMLVRCALTLSLSMAFMFGLFRSSPVPIVSTMPKPCTSTGKASSTGSMSRAPTASASGRSSGAIVALGGRCVPRVRSPRVTRGTDHEASQANQSP